MSNSELFNSAIKRMENLFPILTFANCIPDLIKRDKKVLLYKCTKYIVAAMFLFLISFSSCSTKVDEYKTEGFCGHMNDYQVRIKTDKSFVENIERIEELTRGYVENLNDGANFRTSLVTIPVVVHVVHKNSTENISDTQIFSQIDALNEIFSFSNADGPTVPSPFQSLSTDVKIQFQLAERDPNCNPTNGITRTQTTVSSFDNNPSGVTPQLRNAVKFNSSGGVDGWNSDEYLNFWVCDLNGGLIGYAAFPADLSTRPSEDGIVMDYLAVGTIGTISPNFNMGRVAAHEIGHWLNLRHIWGDESQCSGSDFVDDTPNQAGNNQNCPTFPRLDACSPTTPGVMFMNHMDYTSEACRRMFTVGQSDRMNATLYEVRNSLLGSQSSIPLSSIVSEDLWMKDSDDDIGEEPNTNSTMLYQSDDIWVRTSNDGIINQESQNPIGGQVNYVYVRVRNRGCSPSSTGNLKLYWAKASTGLGWQQPWDGTVTSPALMGSPIGMQVIPSISGNDSQIFTFQWTGPSPSDYSMFGTDRWHFCLLARIETSASSPYGMQFPETSVLWQNVANNNNIVWKNISIYEAVDGDFVSGSFSNFTRNTTLNQFQLKLDNKRNRNLNVSAKSILENGQLILKVDDKLFRKIKNLKNEDLKGIRILEKNLLQVNRLNASIDNLELQKNEIHTFALKYDMKDKFNTRRGMFEVDVLQNNVKSRQTIGGQTFKFLLQ